ncbi:MAG TPA: hypothetical protein VLW65_13660 [Bryobacteraceae bacterium]|nr:hypothetical protein [Bryobacteraceae bacterium]
MRPQTPVPLTFEEHAQLGRELRPTRLRMHELSAVVVEIYGPQNRAAFTFQKIAEALDRLCADLETQAAADLPGQSVDGLYL